MTDNKTPEPHYCSPSCAESVEITYGGDYARGDARVRITAMMSFSGRMFRSTQELSEVSRRGMSQARIQSWNDIFDAIKAELPQLPQPELPVMKT